LHLLNCGLHCTHTHTCVPGSVCVLPTLLALPPPLPLSSAAYRASPSPCTLLLSAIAAVVVVRCFFFSLFVFFLSLRACKPTPAASPLSLWPPRSTAQQNTTQQSELHEQCCLVPGRKLARSSGKPLV